MIQPKFACELVETLLLNKLGNWARYENLQFAQSCLHEIAISSARENTSQRLFEAWKQFATDAQENEQMRGAAVYTLADYYQEDSETLPWLKQLATDSQEHERVRGAAVDVLARYYKNDTDVYVWLKQFLPSAPFSFQRDAVLGWEASNFRAGIDNARVQQAATALNLPEETIRRCYEQLAEEYEFFGFKLSWLPESSSD